MIRYLLNKLRKISKSIGKKEENLIDLITYLDFKKITKTTNEITASVQAEALVDVDKQVDEQIAIAV